VYNCGILLQAAELAHEKRVAFAKKGLKEKISLYFSLIYPSYATTRNLSR
jgi:hypothetical protein